MALKDHLDRIVFRMKMYFHETFGELIYEELSPKDFDYNTAEVCETLGFFCGNEGKHEVTTELTIEQKRAKIQKVLSFSM